MAQHWKAQITPKFVKILYQCPDTGLIVISDGPQWFLTTTADLASAQTLTPNIMSSQRKGLGYNLAFIATKFVNSKAGINPKHWLHSILKLRVERSEKTVCDTKLKLRDAELEHAIFKKYLDDLTDSP